VKFEEACEQAEKAAQAAQQAARRLVAAANALAKAGADGDIGRIRRASDKLSQEAETARHDAADACAAWPLDAQAEERYLREEYIEELLASAQRGGLKMQPLDGTLVAYPVVVRVAPSQRAVTLNRKRVSTLRPSRLVARIKAIQNRRSGGNPSAFLESLFLAYRLIAQGDRTGTAVLLIEIFRILTLLPGMEYTKEDFARDLLHLARSGTSTTRQGARVSFPASTGTRDARSTFICVTPEGETVPFYAIKFTEDIQ
jgi:hypothetical protein